MDQVVLNNQSKSQQDIRILREGMYKRQLQIFKNEITAQKLTNYKKQLPTLKEPWTSVLVFDGTNRIALRNLAFVDSDLKT